MREIPAAIRNALVLTTYFCFLGWGLAGATSTKYAVDLAASILDFFSTFALYISSQAVYGLPESVILGDDLSRVYWR